MNKKLLYLITFLTIFGIDSRLYAQFKNITISSKVNPDKSVDFSYTKDKPGTYTVSLEFSNLENCDITNYKKEVNSSFGFLFKLKPIDNNNVIRYSMKYYTIMGKVNPRVDSLLQYILPFKNGKKVKIYEAGNIGEKYLGQEKNLNWKSYVVKSTEPDTVCGMRKGIVVEIKNDYDDNSAANDYYTSKRNSIVVEHADGSYALYQGFKRNGVFVKLGETVYPQTELGVIEKYDLNGYRLDFSVYFLFDKNNHDIDNYTLKGYKYRYIRPHFVTQEGTLKIESGKEYTALLNEAVITQELSRSEKKKYTQTHSLSN